MTQILKTPKMDKDAMKYPSMSPYSYVLNTFPNAIDPNGKNVYLITYATKDGDVGHTALAVDNYKMVKTKVVENGKEVTKTEFVKTGMVTLYELGPDGGMRGATGKDAATKSVPAKYTTTMMTREKLLGSPASEYARGAMPDGIVMFRTDVQTDMYTEYMMKQYQSENPQYCGTSNNCTDYARYGADIATGRKIDAYESKYMILDAATPNKMYNEAKKAPNATILKDAGKATEKSFDDAYYGNTNSK